MNWLLICTTLALAASNGANDNFKGFATVWGSNTLTYRRALILATVATAAGGLLSLSLAGTLVQEFSGKGLVPDAIVASPRFVSSVAGASAVTVFIATRLGLPVSTTHALIGGLVGAGLAQGAETIHLGALTGTFLLPLLFSPVIATGLGIATTQAIQRRTRRIDCACITKASIDASAHGTAMLIAPAVVVGSAAECSGLVTSARVSIPRTFDRLHIASAAAICFARAVNDTPKLAALLIATHAATVSASLSSIIVTMALGGVLFARRVAETMSQRVTRMDHGQGLAANLITALLVLFASKLGMPVSTTHVAVGSIAGVGASAGTLEWAALRNILLSWIATLPLAIGVAWVIGRFF